MRELVHVRGRRTLVVHVHSLAVAGIAMTTGGEFVQRTRAIGGGGAMAWVGASCGLDRRLLDIAA